MSNAKNLATFLQSGGSIAGDANFDSNTLFVDASANRVGIGTNSPSTALDVTGTITSDGLTLDNNGSIIFNDPQATDTMLIGTNDDDLVIRADAGDILLKTNNNSTSAVVDTSGNFGIGTSSPITISSAGPTLEVSGTAGGTLVLTDSNATSGQRSKYLLSQGGALYIGDSADDGSSPSNNVVVDTSGNLLVGKTSNSSAVEGAMLFNDGRVFGTKNGNYCAQFNRLTSDGEIIQFRKDGTTVGSIGTANSDLHIDGLANHSGIRFQAGSLLPRLNGSDTDNTIDLGYDDGSAIHRFKDLYLSGNASMARTRLTTNSGTTYWDLRRDSGTGHLVISDDGLGDVITVTQTDGRIGVNVTNPEHMLHIKGDDPTGDGASIQLEVNNNNSTDRTGIIRSGNNASNTTTAISFETVGGNQNGEMRFYTRDGSTTQVRTVIDSDGRLKITNSAAPTLRIENTDTSITTNQTVGDIDFYQSDASGSGAGVVGKIRSINDGSSFAGQASLSFHTGTASSLAQRMRISSTGQLFLYSQSSGAGNATLKYTTGTGAVTYDTSSRLVKENIVDCPYGLTEIVQLQPRKYFRTDDQANEVGLIADEVQSIMPEFVPTGEKSLITGIEEDTEIIPLGVNYDKMIAPLVQAIKDLNAKIETLETKVATLEGA